MMKLLTAALHGGFSSTPRCTMWSESLTSIVTINSISPTLVGSKGRSVYSFCFDILHTNNTYFFTFLNTVTVPAL